MSTSGNSLGQLVEAAVSLVRSKAHLRKRRNRRMKLICCRVVCAAFGVDHVGVVQNGSQAVQTVPVQRGK